METLNNKLSFYGAIHAGLAVMLGAFGAHGLEGWLTADRLAIYETGVRYHMYHALGMILAGILLSRGDSRKLRLGGRLMHIGIFLFSGSLYVLVLTGFTKLGMVTPLGGVLFIAGWALIAAAVWPAKQR
ncbi:DUF423 domain-containing protein [Paenibacillus tarimensis]|uniref:DUF423 domain-containing protein n=1 Tax=Paenibacillus tarimensis TaxID=416012 RepID=UPI001F354135|nr:DUF423 domain-containing protein [Paenibacillus tarimensis]MCF2943853.1 DUF423 domain-containing protein [Paenibacillus tarimensis]